MSDSITFVGVGGGRIVLSSGMRGTGGFVINIADRQIHVDPGPGALTKASEYRVDAQKTDTIFVSHEHIDHANDVNALIAAITLDGVKNTVGTLLCPLTVSQKGSWLLTRYKDLLKQVVNVKVGEQREVGNLIFEITETKHDAEDAVGFKLHAPTCTIGYTGDTKYFPKMGKIYKGCHVLIANVLRPGKEEYKTHMCSEDAVQLATATQPELFVIQHFGGKMLNEEPLYEAREIQRRTGIRTIAANDGLRIGLRGVSDGEIS